MIIPITHTSDPREVPVKSVQPMSGQPIYNDGDRYPCCEGEARIPRWQGTYSRTCKHCGRKWLVTPTRFGANWSRDNG